LQRNGRLKCGHSLDQLQPCAYRPLGIVLVSLPVAEIHEHAVAHVLRYGRNIYAKRLGRLQINNELEFGRLEGGQVRYFSAANNFSGVHAGLAKCFGEASTVAR
jgi:hypothetical protein